MTRCPKCGAHIKYIPVSFQMDVRGTIAVEPDYTELVNDGGRIVKGHVRHRCPEAARTNTMGGRPSRPRAV
jgi:hypothetical protein